MELKINGEINEEMLAEIANSLVTYEAGEDVDITIDSLGGYVNTTEDILSLFEECRAKGSIFSITNSGDVMSCATLIWLFCDDRIWNTDNGEFLIHNPYVEEVSGDAEAILETGVQLADMENDIVNMYAAFSDTPKETIINIMKENRPLTLQELEMLGFCTKKKKTIVSRKYVKK